MTSVVHTRAEFAAARVGRAEPVGLVPTMGALHGGHLALIRAARSVCETVIVTLFVNPLQFGPSEDLAEYPRRFDADVVACEKAGVDVLWAPSVAEVYPGGPGQVRVDPGPLGRALEGEFRPTHFGGVLTVVAKFLGLVGPAVAYFGEKDYQQLALITRMAGDLELGVGIIGVETVREPDGLALSSRNLFLSAQERQHALMLSRALFAGRSVASAGGGGAATLAAAQTVLGAAPEVRVDYLELRDPELAAAPDHGPARLLVAARVGRTRLIDNVAVTL